REIAALHGKLSGRVDRLSTGGRGEIAFTERNERRRIGRILDCTQLASGGRFIDRSVSCEALFRPNANSLKHRTSDAHKASVVASSKEIAVFIASGLYEQGRIAPLAGVRQFSHAADGLIRLETGVDECAGRRGRSRNICRDRWIGSERAWICNEQYVE